MPVRSPVARRFADIREWDGSQHRAFEELCFQLRDPTPDGIELRKTKAPDAGVEWYWEFPDGHQEGWQAKFIPDADTLIGAMRESLDTVRDKRPEIRVLTFCLPIDLADDPSKARGVQLRQRLDKAIEGWKKRAPDITVKFQHGGELLERLAREEHRGREWFFFQERVLGQGWCAEALQGTIDDAGSRYTPQQDVDLPIDRTLEAVALPTGFVETLRERRDAVLLNGREFLDERDDPAWAEQFAATRAALLSVEPAAYLDVAEGGLDPQPLLAAIEAARTALMDLDDVVRPVAWPREERDPSRPVPEAQDAAAQAAAQAADRRRFAAQGLVHESSRLARALRELRALLRGSSGQAAHKQALFVTGPAGSGKTHLCCDAAERLLAQGHPVLVILGDKFRDASPWQTLARQLGDPALSPDEIATCLAASGEAAGKRAFVAFDALNETPDTEMWATELADVRRRLTRTGWGGFAVTCRTTYVDLVEPPGGPDQEFVRIEHPGYQGREFEAAEQIFAANSVQAPRVPLLIPEFSNPLFLKLYCQGVAQDRPGTLAGTEHLSEVFSRFASNRAREVERRLRLSSHLVIVELAMKRVADRLAASGGEELPFREAWNLLADLAPHKQESPDTLLETMLAEGLLAVERHYVAGAGRRETFVAFPYQRFSDHLILKAFLAGKIDDDASAEEVVAAFAGDQPLAAIPFT